MESNDVSELRMSQAVTRFALVSNVTATRVYGSNCHKLMDSDGKLHGYALVVDHKRRVANAFPLPVTCKELVNLFEKRFNPIVIWSCDDGIVYANLSDIRGEILSGKHHQELIAVYDKSKSFKYVRF
jgi:hypothetical protein